jgi:hypothetical protein
VPVLTSLRLRAGWAAADDLALPALTRLIREPATGILAIKRVAARGSRDGLRAAPAGGPDTCLEPREAWLLGDAPSGSIDSRTYGPLDADAFVARAWLRYGPPGRVGRIR